MADIARYKSNRELIVLAHPDVLPNGPAGPPAALTVREFRADSVRHPELAGVLTRFDAALRPLFSATPLSLSPGGAFAPAAPSDAHVYHRVVAEDASLDPLAEALRPVPSIEAAYVKPAAEPPVNRMFPMAAPPAVGTPSFSNNQIYLGAAPAGVDTLYAWTQPGGRGHQVNIVDVEGEWQLAHEDLLANNRGLLGGTFPNDAAWRNHGTSVIGILNGTDNGRGVTAICPEATVGVISIFGDNRTSSEAIREAAQQLNTGDLLLIELHRPGPRLNYQPDSNQRGYIAVEWWPDDFDAIQFATSRGVIVVEAAGNGAENLDDALYATAAPGFPPGWTNPFPRLNADSGAVLVAAGAPPPGTHGRNWGTDRSRLDFSNYGDLIDAQGWGREVTSCGYGDLQGGLDEKLWYTDQFAGTSSASPIIVGTLACLQGIRRGAGLAPLTPSQTRNLLRSTGSPQQAGQFPVSQRIGNRPDLKQLIPAALAIA